LFDTNHQISDYTKLFSKKLDKLGYLIIVATGRHHLDAMPLIASPVSVYLVSSNGVREIHSPEKNCYFLILQVKPLNRY
jgi:hydroxymethylpyrimidine pyrophosphatase-like HAD family hydrolase